MKIFGMDGLIDFYKGWLRIGRRWIGIFNGRPVVVPLIQGGTSATLTQEDFRFRNDDGSLATATWFDGDTSNNNDKDVVLGTTFRLRFVVQGGGKDVQNYLFDLWCSKNSGTYFQVTSASTLVQLTNDANSLADHATTQQRIGNGTPSTGDLEGYNDGTTDNTTGNMDLASGAEVEVEVCITILETGNAATNTFDFRLRNEGATFNTYSFTPRATALAAPVHGTATLDGVGSIIPTAKVTHEAQATLPGVGTVTAVGSVPGTVFLIDFEEQDLSDFDTTTNPSSAAANAGSAMVGDYGCEVTYSSASPFIGQMDSANILDPFVSSGIFRLRFYFDPNDLSFGTGDSFWLAWLHCDGTLSSITRLFALVFYDAGGGTYEVNLSYKNDSDGTSSTNLTALPNEPCYIEIYSKRATNSGSSDGSIRLYVNGALTGGYNDALDNYDLWPTMDDFRIGITFGEDATTSGTFYLDDIITKDGGDLIGPVAGDVTGAAALAGVGLIAPLAEVVHQAQAQLDGSGTLTAIGQRLVQAQAQLDGAGTLAASGAVFKMGNAQLDGIGSITALAEVVHQALSQLDGIGSITALAEVVHQANAQLDGVATLTALGSVAKMAQSQLDGVGTITPLAEVVHQATVTLAGVGTLTALAEIVHQANAQLDGVGSLAAVGSIGAVTHTAQAQLDGVGSITPLAEAVHQARSTLAGVGSITAVGSVPAGIEFIGSVISNQISNSGSATNITIPTGATFCLIGAAYYETSPGWTSCDVTLDSQTANLIYFDPFNSSHNSMSVWRVDGFSTGSGKTLTWDWSGTNNANEGVAWVLLFFSGVAASPIRDYDVVIYNGTTAQNNTTPTIDSADSDLMVGLCGAYAVTIDMDLSGQTECITPGVYNNAQYDAAYIAGSDSGVTMTGYFRSGMLIALSLIPAEAVTPVTGAAVLNGVGTLAGVAEVVHQAESTLAGVGSLIADPALIAVSGATLPGIGTLTAIGVIGAVTHTAQATLDGIGTLSGTAEAVHQAVASISGVGSITPTAEAIHQAQSQLDGIGTLDGLAEIVHQAISALGGVGSLVATAEAVHQAQTQLDGIGSLIASAQTTHSAQAQLDGTATLAAVGAAEGEILGRAQLNGIGSLSADATGIFGGTASLIGEGTLTGFPTLLHLAQSSLQGIGTLSSSGAVIFVSASTLDGIAILSGTPHLLHLAQSSLQGIGTLTSAGAVVYISAAQLDGSATITGFAIIEGELLGKAQLDGVGSLTPLAEVIHRALSALNGEGQVTADSSMILVSASVLDGIGTLTTLAEVVHQAIASMSGIGSISALGQRLIQAQAILDGIGSLTAIGSVEALAEITGAAILNGIGDILPDGSVTFISAASLPGVASLDAEGHLILHGVSPLDGIATLSSQGALIVSTTALLSGIATFTPTGYPVKLADVTLSGLATMMSGGVVTYGGAAIVGGTASVDALGRTVLGIPVTFDILVYRREDNLLEKEDE